jgi:hypothetical protein
LAVGLKSLKPRSMDTITRIPRRFGIRDTRKKNYREL